LEAQVCTTVADIINSLSCGHVFCAQCLQQSFTLQLTDRLKFFQDKSDVDFKKKISVPLTDEQQVKLVEILKDYTAYSPSFFWYDCPDERCRMKVKKMPTQSYQIKSSIDSVNQTIQK